MIRAAVFWLVLGAMSLAQVHYLKPMENRKGWVVFGCLMGLTVAVGTSLILDWSLPSPMSGIRGVVEPLGRSILH